MMPGSTGACYDRFNMVRRRWPDVVIVVAIMALIGGGVWALWGDEIRGKHEPGSVEQVEGTGAAT